MGVERKKNKSEKAALFPYRGKWQNKKRIKGRGGWECFLARDSLAFLGGL
uniref:Uncharacterized protein n=1 Tax=Meloidogyne enterolobii TaxID=390850 RepID=A0A6V7XKL1_MELEN|nr:unnamed protein product [Meloidogyne enterolobii]